MAEARVISCFFNGELGIASFHAQPDFYHLLSSSRILNAGNGRRCGLRGERLHGSQWWQGKENEPRGGAVETAIRGVVRDI